MKRGIIRSAAILLLVFSIFSLTSFAYNTNNEEIADTENNSPIEENKNLEDNKTLTAQEKIDNLAKETLLK